MKFLNIKFNVKNNIILYTTIFLVLVWYIIFGFSLIHEPYVWDDLHFFRKYSNEELRNIWISNWDSDRIETPAYRPFAVLYYHLLYIIFEENTFLLRNFVVFEALTLIQTKKAEKFPVILVDKSFWQGCFEWIKERLLENNNYISEIDLDLFSIVDSPDEVVDILNKFYDKKGFKPNF